MTTSHWIGAALLSFSVTAHAQYRHVSLNSETPPLPQKVVIIPAEIKVQELSAGGQLSPVPELTERASANLSNASQRFLTEKKSLTVVGIPTGLSAEEQEQLDDYLATFFVVGTTAFGITQAGGDAWQQKQKQFDYSLGQGLNFLREKTGADAALMIVGEDVVSSDGRKAAAVFGAMFGVGLQMGYSIVFISMVDLRTGDLLWIHSTHSAVKDLSDTAAASKMISGLLTAYPKGKQ